MKQLTIVFIFIGLIDLYSGQRSFSIGSNSSPLSPECWKQRNGYYVQEGHGQENECYATIEEAKAKCLAAGDCRAIATQNNVCGGKFRVTHGSPTFVAFANWKPYAIVAYEYTCGPEIIADPQNNNKKCGPEGSPLRVFDLRGKAATEAKCKEACLTNGLCVAFSGKWGKWCVGCKVELAKQTVDPGDQGAIAFKKLGTSVKVLPELGKSCISEGSYQITTETDCKAAATELGLTWGSSWNGQNEMPGCVYAEDWRKKVYFNTSPKAGYDNPYNKAHYAEICKVASVEKIQGGTLCSDMGLKEINSEDKCHAAAVKLNLTWAHSWNGQNEIPGCIFATDWRKKVFYNTSPNPSRSKTNLNPNYEAICEGSIGIPIHVAKRGAECKSADEYLGHLASLADCAKACKEKMGCKYFIYGYGNKARSCHWEKTKNADCPEGWETDDFNFYEMEMENNGEYVLGPKGSGSCSEGTQIIDEASCREACRTLNLPQGIVLGNHKCYKNKQGKCFQDGRQGSGASLICKTSGQNPECWKQRNGYYVQEGHGQENECYATIEEAKAKCLAAGDCRAIATQNNVCGGKFRVTHGSPTFVAFANWKPYAMVAYEYTCGPESLPYCVKIQTGPNGKNNNNNGYLNVFINGVPMNLGHYDVNQIVLDKCYADLRTISVQNINNDAWEGSITVTVNGTEQVLTCDGCGGSPFGKEIVVDGNSDSADQAPTNCLNGKKCTLKISGGKGSGKPGCTCKDLINSHGQGNCQGNPSNVLGKQICYVNQPSTCTDARTSLGSLPGEQFSAQACEFDDEFTKDGYLVENGKYCEGNMNERMLNETNVIDARLWCTKNPSCAEIYSVCGRKNTFAYCKKDDKILPSSCGSKMFTKAKWACPFYDVGFILDGSGSVTKPNWLKELKFTKEVAKLAEITKDGSRAGVISFASTPVLKIKFTDHDNYASFSNAVDRLPFTAGGTNIIKALQDGLDEMFVPRIGQQVDNIRLAFLITDGKDGNAKQKYIDMKKNYEKHHIALFVIAVGSKQNVDEDKLKVLDQNFLQVSDFDKLKEVFHTRVGHNMCKPSNFTVPSCSTLKVTNADYADGNGQYEYLPAVRSPWAPDRPVYKRVNSTGGSTVRYIFMSEGTGNGWVIGGPTQLMRTNGYFHQSGHKAKEPWKGGSWRKNEIVTCDNGLCCQAQVATCLACKANQTIEDYCRLNPLTTGCPRETCSKIQCANGGTCVEIGRGTKCKCPSGFVGIHCETKDLCDGYQCANGGTCNVTNGMPQCLCPLGYLGSHCEKKDRCYDYQCLNGGQCVENNGLPECRCARQYHGCHCEQKDPCADFQCSNGGTCIENNGTPKCSCPSGFSGTHCGEKDPCYNYKCANGGTCVENNDSPICNCPSGFSGIHCEKRAACASYQCANGGSCVETNGTATCNCPKGFSGEHCGEKDALEGQRCGGRSGRPCAEGLQCIGKIQKTGGQGTCRKSSNNCPNGVPVVKCLIDPCQRKTCSDQKATCVSNYCGGCNAVFYDYAGQNKAKCLPNLFGCKGNQIALMDPHKKFLQILPSGEGIATSKIMTNLKGSIITFEDLGGDNFNSTLQSYTDRKVALKSEYGKYLVAYPGPNFDIRADGTSPARGGTFVLRHNDQTPKQYWFRTMYTKTENGRQTPLYMWDTKGKLRGNADDVRRWEKFIPTCLDDGNSANGIEEGYGSVLGAITSENDGEYGLELGSGMGITLGSGRDGSCEDISRRCDILANGGKCTTDPGVQRYCKKSCGLCGWKKFEVGGRAWDVSQCSKLGERKITDGKKYRWKTDGDKACKGYCNDIGNKRCNAINWNPSTSECIAWSCGTPIPLPLNFLPGFEAYTREEKESSYVGQSYDNMGMQSSSYGYSGNMRQLGSEVPTGYTQMWSPNAETVLRYKSNDLTSSFQGAQQLNGFNNPNTVHMVADVKVQAFNDETLRVKLEHMRFYGRNGEVPMIEAHEILDPMSSGNGHDMHGAQVFKTFLEDPMLIFVKKGRAKNLLVSKNEPDCITKIKQEVANGLLQNGQPQFLQVVKKNGILQPMKISTNVKKIDLI